MLVVAVVAGFLAVLSPPLASPSAAAEGPYVVPPGGSWTVDGAGWGHGIGMSQWGAQGAALQGLTFNDILAFYYPGTVLGYVANPTIRVQLTKHVDSFNVFGPIGVEPLTARDVSSGQSQVLPAASRYLVQADANGMYLGYWTGAAWSPIFFGGSRGVVGPIEVTGASGIAMYDRSMSGAGTQYRGMVRLLRSGSSAVQAVNILPLDDYLKGVVPRESPSSWHAEALRSQAVAARSYALSVSSPGGSWDLCDTDQCQVYGGRASIATNGAVTSLEATSTTEAVTATSGIVVAYNNRPAFTQFSSSNGGYSVAGSQPYLTAKPDPYSGSAPGDPVSRWRTDLPASRLQAHCPSGGVLQSFEITGRDGLGPFGGRITSVRVNCSNGSTTVT
ncbi:MAG: SpoIID/LytB domain-containing protein, partial [Acidimicrobiales bacterium]